MISTAEGDRRKSIDRKITLLIVLWVLDKLVMAILLYLI